MNAEPLPAAPATGDYWAALRRRLRPALWTAVGVLIAAIATAALWPPSYVSTGTILIEQQELPADLVQSTISSYADQRIQVIAQRVMTTENLLRIIDRYNLYPKMRRNEPREVVLEKMHQDVHLQMISADVMDPKQGRATKANIAFTVSYDSRSAQLAAQVANELITLYLDENVKTRKKLSADAASFLDDEANKLDKSIAQKEASLASFKDRHINALPDEIVVNRELLVHAEDELRDIDTQLRSLAQQQSYLDAQLAQMSPTSQVYTSTGERVLSPADRLKYLRTELARVSAIYSPDHPDVVRMQQEVDGLERANGSVDSTNDLERQLQDARARLADMQQRYAPDHPDVIRVQQQIDSLTQAMRAAPTRPPGTEAKPDNPAYIQIKAQKESTAAQTESLLQKRESLETKIADLQGRIASAPIVQRDFDALARELDNDQLKYREVRQKQMEAKLSENLEDEQKGERFTLIDPPLIPEKPASPNRWLLLSVGAILALALSLGVVVLLESRDSSIRNRRDLESLLQVPPLAVLPYFETREERARTRRARRLALAGAFGTVLLVLVLTHLLYRPLDVLWDVAMRKLAS